MGARSARFSGVSKTIVAATVQTITFPANEIEGSGVIAYSVQLQGVGNDLADIDRIRVTASGEILVDVSIAQLRTFTEGNFKTGTVQALTDTFLLIPLYLPDAVDMDTRDACQFPLGAQPQVEIDFLGTVAAGSCILNWVKSDVQPRFTSRLYSSQLNIPASVANARYSFQDGGVVRGIIMNTVGVDRARLRISDREAFYVAGPQFSGLTIGSGFRALRMGEQPATVVDPFFIPVSLGLPAAVGSSYLELDTGAAWAGVGNEVVVWSMVQIAQAANGRNG